MLSPTEIDGLTAGHPSPAAQAQGAELKRLPVDYRHRARRKYAAKVEAYVRMRLDACLTTGEKMDPQTRALAEMVGLEHEMLRPAREGRDRATVGRSAHATGKNAKHRGRGVQADRERQEEALGLVDAGLAELVDAAPRAKRAAHVSADADTLEPTSAGVAASDATSEPIPR